MTGRELIVYILKNNLENENIFNPGEDLEGCIFIREDRAAADCGVGVATIKALQLLWKHQKRFEVI